MIKAMRNHLSSLIFVWSFPSGMVSRICAEKDTYMGTTSVVFIKGVVEPAGLPEASLPVVAFFGRSNVGKSSVINSLFKKKDLAKSSSQPGRTTEINYFLVDGKSYLADLPGYGYARLSRSLKAKIGNMISWYVGSDEVDFKWVVLIVDASIGVQDSDREIFSILNEYERRVIIVANKSDKGKRNDVSNHIRAMREDFPGCPIIRYSTKTGEGRGELFSTLWS